MFVTPFFREVFLREIEDWLKSPRIAWMPYEANPLVWRWPIAQIYWAFVKERGSVTRTQFFLAIQACELETYQHWQGGVAELRSEGWALMANVTPRMLEARRELNSAVITALN